MFTVTEQSGWILPNQVCEIIEETGDKYLLECFDGYDGTIKKEWVPKHLVKEIV